MNTRPPRRGVPWSFAHLAHSAVLVRMRHAFVWCDVHGLPSHALRLRAWRIAAADGYRLLCRLEDACISHSRRKQ